MLKKILKLLEKQSESFKFDSSVKGNRYHKVRYKENHGQDTCLTFYTDVTVLYVVEFSLYDGSYNDYAYLLSDYTTSELVTKIIEDFNL